MYPASRGRSFTRVALGSSRIETVTVSSSFSSSDSMIQAGIPILSLGAENSRTPTCVDREVLEFVIRNVSGCGRSVLKDAAERSCSKAVGGSRT